MRRVLIAGLLFVAAVPQSSAEIIDRVLATVDGRVITLSDVRMAQRLGLLGPAAAEDVPAARNRLIERALVLDEVDRFAPPEPPSAEVEKGIAAVRARFASDGAFEEALRAAGVERSAVRQWVRNDLRLRAYIDQRFAGTLEPTREEIENELRQPPSGPDGAPLAGGEAERAARERVMQTRREALVREWIESLKNRARISLNRIDPAPSG